MRAQVLKWFFKFLPKTLGLALFFILLMHLDRTAIVVILGNTDLRLLGLALILTWLAMAVRAQRWRAMLKYRNVDLSYQKAFVLFIASLFWGAVTPGRVGELIRVSYLKQLQIDSTKSVTSVIADRLLDVGVLFAISIFLLWDFWIFSAMRVDTRHLVFGSYASAILLSMIVITWLSPPLRSSRWIKIISRMSINVITEVKSYTARLWCKAIYHSAIAWTGFLGSRWALAESLALDVEPWFLFGAIAAGSILSMLPITIQGIGTRDVVLVGILAHVGINLEQAMALSSLILAIIVLNTLVAWVFHLKAKNY